MHTWKSLEGKGYWAVRMADLACSTFLDLGRYHLTRSLCTGIGTAVMWGVGVDGSSASASSCLLWLAEFHWGRGSKPSLDCSQACAGYTQPAPKLIAVLGSPDSCDAGNWISSFLRWITTLFWDYFSKHHLIIGEIYPVKQSLEPQNRPCGKLSLMSRSYTPICPSVWFPMVDIVCLTSPAVYMVNRNQKMGRGRKAA